MTRKMTSWPIFLVIVGVVIASVVIYRLKVSGDWPAVDGKILVSQIETVKQERRAIERTDDYRVEHLLTLNYNYSMGGKAYQGTRILATGPNVFNDHQGAQSMMERFPVGATVPVYVNPKNPADACLITGAGLPIRAYLAMGVVVVVVLAIMIVGILVVTGKIDVAALIERFHQEQ
jgi:hypothetical protein